MRRIDGRLDEFEQVCAVAYAPELRTFFRRSRLSFRRSAEVWGSWQRLQNMPILQG